MAVHATWNRVEDMGAFNRTHFFDFYSRLLYLLSDVLCVTFKTVCVRCDLPKKVVVVVELITMATLFRLYRYLFRFEGVSPVI